MGLALITHDRGSFPIPHEERSLIVVKIKKKTPRFALQVLCPCAKRRHNETLEDVDNCDTNTLGLSAQDLRDPAAIVSYVAQHPPSAVRVFMCVSELVFSLGGGLQRRGATGEGGTTEVTESQHGEDWT